MKNVLSIVALYILSLLCANAQEGKLLTVNHELSSSMINHIYQDKEGIIWISTEDGLNRYDGAKFTIFRYDEDSPTSLMSNYVRRTFEDSRDRIFIGTLNGVQFHNKKRGTFHTIPIRFESGESLNAQISSIIERNNGEILIGSAGHGIFRLNAHTDSLVFIQDTSLSNNFFINHLYEDKLGQLWITTASNITMVTPAGFSKQYLTESVPEGLSCVCEDALGNIYAGSLHEGMFVLDKKQDKIISIPHSKDLVIKSLYVANQEEIYIGTDGGGMKVYNILQKEISDNRMNVTALDFSKAKVHSILKDNQGNTWIGCFQKGVVIIPAITNGFHYIGHHSITSNSIGSCCIMSICRDHNGDLWIGTDSDGLYLTEPSGKRKAHFPNLEGPNSATVMSIYEDSNHDIWVGTFQQGLFRKRQGANHFERFLLPTATNNKQTNIYSIVEDQYKQLWIGAMGDGMYKIDLKSNRIQTMPFVANGLRYTTDQNVLHNRWINCLLYSSDDKLYYGTFDGFGCLDIKTESFVSTYNINRMLSGELIYSMYEDHNHNIWIGTDYGLKRFNPQNKEFKTYTTKHGLPSNSISGITADSDGHLWISTSFGLSRFHLASETFVNFFTDDGLQGNEFTKRAVFKGLRGDINLGGTDGVTFFNPKEITNPGKKPQIHISDFYVFGVPIRKGSLSGGEEITTTKVSQSKEFHLSHNDNSFSIEFSAMEFYSPERITYMYNVNNKGWATLHPGSNRIAFSHVEPGTYHFQVRAKDYANFSDIKEFRVIISPPWYDTGWAKFLFGILFGLILLGIVLQIRHRYRSRQEMLEHKHAEEINEAKLQFFINISHEIRTPMTLITSPLMKLISQDQNEERQKSYRLIHRNAERILSLINQLMDIRKIDKGQMTLKFREMDIVPFIKDVYSVFEYQAQTKNITLSFSSQDEKVMAWIDRKNFDKIIFNLISNAIKYTPQGGHIDISLSTGHNPDAPTPALRHFMEIRVKDDGIGLNENEIHRIFDRFYQIGNHFNNSNTGTGVGLHLTRSLVELHHGEISARNNEDGKGCSFIIRIPLGKEHINPEHIDLQNEATTSSTLLIETNKEKTILPEYAKEESPVRSKTKHRILIAEDDEEIRRYLCQELGTDFHVMECENGKDALSQILNKTPDLVISDVMMPEMDGVTLCRKIKQNVNINHIPVILLTAKTREEDTIEGLQHGADAYITKPFNIEILRQNILNLIKGRELLKNNYNGNQIQEEKVTKIKAESPDERLLNRVMKVINENMSNANLNVEMIASEVGISRVHLHRKLKELTNQSTRDFIRNVRLKQAATLLSEKKHSVSEVATLTGFPNVAYFSTAFKDLYGVSPSAYMSRNLEEKQDSVGLS